MDFNLSAELAACRFGDPQRPVTADEVIDRLRAGELVPNVELRAVDLTGKDLSGLSMRDLDLTEVDLSRVNLSWADLTDAVLYRANLSGAELVKADLTRADLSECNAERTGFGGTTLNHTTFFRAQLSGSSFTQAEVRCVDFRTANLKGARFQNAALSQCLFAGANLQSANFERADVEGSDFHDADLRHAHLKELRGFKTSSWISADIRDVDFCGAYLVRRHIMDQNYLHEFRRDSPKVYWIWWVTSDCGRSFLRWALWTTLVAVLFAGFYSFAAVDFGDYETPFSPLYYSLVTLTTLGYGDVLPASGWAQFLAVCEVIVGYVALGG
ncbi:MAG: pentapeptide repeat-containing protein, partial [Myxococcales bacterium]|nr:pentapeptide repeat-containing protein [Myxococcales bacterium]